MIPEQESGGEPPVILSETDAPGCCTCSGVRTALRIVSPLRYP
jgi:hypothetical protein